MEQNVADTAKKNTYLRSALNIIFQYALILLLIVLGVVVSIVQPRFLTTNNLLNILNQISVIGVLACGMTFVIIIGCIDLSVGSMMSLIGILALSVLDTMGDIPAIVISVLAGGVIGLITGGIIAAIKGRLGESFMVTYGMQSVLAAFALIVSGGLFMMVNSTKQFSQIGKGLYPVAVFIVLVVICQLLLSYTSFGRNVLFMGANPVAARLSGIPVQRYTLIVFMLCGFITAIAGVLLPSRVMSANPNAGVGYELDAIAACVVGGISMKGGSGSFINTLTGVIVIGVLGNALNLLGVTSYPQMIIKGLVIALAVALDILNKSRQAERS